VGTDQTVLLNRLQSGPEITQLLCQIGCSPDQKLSGYVISGPDCSLFGKAV